MNTLESLSFGWLRTDIWPIVHLQIKERLKRRMNAIFPSYEVGNSARKSSRVNASDAGKIRAVEMQSFDA